MSDQDTCVLGLRPVVVDDGFTKGLKAHFHCWVKKENFEGFPYALLELPDGKTFLAISEYIKFTDRGEAEGGE